MITDTPQDERRAGIGGTALLLIVSFATIITVAAEAAFMSRASWALLPVIVLAIVIVAAAVVGTVSRLIDSGDGVSARTAHRH
jgi:hypothetical protein